MEWIVSTVIGAIWMLCVVLAFVYGSIRDVTLGFWKLPRSQVLRVGVIIICSASLVLLWIWESIWSILRISGALGTSSNWYSWLDLPYIRWPLLSTFALTPFVFAYSKKIEPFWLCTTHLFALNQCQHNLQEEENKKELLIAVISDLHVGNQSPGAWRNLVSTINSKHPQITLFLGDSLNEEECLDRFQALLKSISSPCKLAVRGNWDQWYWNDLNLLDGTGFQWLDGKFVDFNDDENGINVRIGGTSYYHNDEETSSIALSLFDNDSHSNSNTTTSFIESTSNLTTLTIKQQQSQQSVSQTRWNIYANHTPDPIDYISKFSSQTPSNSPLIDLMVSGHTHGGQVWIPFIGAIAILSRHGVKYARGLHSFPDSGVSLYVNSGIGVEPALPYRLFCRPEITFIHLPQKRQDAKHNFALSCCC